jgi:hypothetical protein
MSGRPFGRPLVVDRQSGAVFVTGAGELRSTRTGCGSCRTSLRGKSPRCRRRSHKLAGRSSGSSSATTRRLPRRVTTTSRNGRLCGHQQAELLHAVGVVSRAEPAGCRGRAAQRTSCTWSGRRPPAFPQGTRAGSAACHSAWSRTLLPLSASQRTCPPTWRDEAKIKAQ